MSDRCPSCGVLSRWFSSVHAPACELYAPDDLPSAATLLAAPIQEPQP